MRLMQMVCLLAARGDAVDGATVGSFDVHPQQVDALITSSLAEVSRSRGLPRALMTAESCIQL
jgi:hypothetical protein